jgi:hypothetical protein
MYVRSAMSNQQEKKYVCDHNKVNGESAGYSVLLNWQKILESVSPPVFPYTAISPM